MSAILIEQRRRNLGTFEVGRILPYAHRRMVGSFIFFDHLGPVDLPKGLSREADVRPHPHIGLSTVTYLFAGEIMHRDSTGSGRMTQPVRLLRLREDDGCSWLACSRRPACHLQYSRRSPRATTFS